MFTMANNFLIISFILIFSQNFAWSQSGNLEWCYKYENTDNKLSEIKDITLGWSLTTDQASLLVVKGKDDKKYVSDLDCPLFPSKGICGLSDDGGEIEILKVDSTQTKILLKISGLIIPEIMKPEGYTYLSIHELTSVSPRYVVLNKVSSDNCFLIY